MRQVRVRSYYYQSINDNNVDVMNDDLSCFIGFVDGARMRRRSFLSGTAAIAAASLTLGQGPLPIRRKAVAR